MPNEPALKQRDEAHGQRVMLWLVLAWLAVALPSLSLHFGSALRSIDGVRDEVRMKVPIDDILDHGWTVETMLDYQEVKGPTFYWSYAAAGELLGGSMNAMRFTTLLFFIAGGIPLLLIACRCVRAGPALVAVGVFYLLIPYNLPQGQLLMSETSFIFFALLAMWVFVWGFGDSAEREHRIAGPVLFGIVLSLALHHRPHAVALAGAVALVSLERDWLRSWPWWLACALAGVSRLPLWSYWGGMVTSDYQGLFGLGLRLDSMTYMLAALVPSTAILLWPALLDHANRRRLWLVYLGGVIGLVVALSASPDLYTFATYHNPSTGEVVDQRDYLGTVSTVVRTVSGAGVVQYVLLALLSTLGGASLGAFAAVAWQRPVRSMDGVVQRLAFWTLAVGIPLYVITKGPVYDRYLLVWSVLLPIVWVRALPRAAQVVQGIMLTAMLGYFVMQYFV